MLLLFLGFKVPVFIGVCNEPGWPHAAGLIVARLKFASGVAAIHRFPKKQNKTGIASKYATLKVEKPSSKIDSAWFNTFLHYKYIFFGAV